MAGALLMGLALLQASPASADVLYLDPETVPGELEKTGWGTAVRRGGKTYRCFQGRILEVLATPRGATRPRIRFELARVSGTKGAPLIEWPAPKRSYELETFERVEHELDGFFDLQAMFSNRDLMLRAMAGDRTICIGREPFHTYFLLAGGVDVGARRARLRRAESGRFAGLVQGGRLRAIDEAAFKGVPREGWLVNWLLRGGPMAPSVRADRLRRVYTSRRVDGTRDFAATIHGFHPLTHECPIETLGFQLLTAAAQDFRYTDEGRQPGGPFGFGMESTADGPKGTARVVPRFGSVCLDALGALCAQVNEDHPGAEAMGYMARAAVLSALYAARVGTSDAADRTETSFKPPTPDQSPLRHTTTWLSQARWLANKGRLDDAEQALAEARGAAKGVRGERARTMLAKQIARTEALLRRLRKKPPSAARPAPPVGLTTYLRTDPGDRAEAALRVIARGASWRTARFDSSEARSLARRWATMAPAARPAAKPRPGAHLILALLGLVREAQVGTEARAGDRVRSPPAAGTTTLLEASLVRTFDHLLVGGRDRSVFLAHLGDGLVDAVSATTSPRADGGLAQEDVPAASSIEFALRMLRRAGAVPSKVMDDVVERLFTLALTADSGGKERDRLRHAIRRNAVACLAELASFGARSKAGPDALKSHLATSRRVARRLEALMQDTLEGHGGTSALRFFKLVGSMARETEPTRRLEGEAEGFADLCTERLARFAAKDPARAAGIKRLRALVNPR